jgi:CHAT domain-containing protein
LAGPEAARVAELLGGRALIGDDATELALRSGLAEARVLHLATHGMLEPMPLQSSVLLAHGQALSGDELVGLDLRGTALVVLSGCDTARGRTTSGEEVLGLTRGLLAAGADATLATLWRVHDHSTPLMMAALYGALRDGLTPAQALAAAQRHMLGLDEERAGEERRVLLEAAERAGHPVPEERREVQPLDYAHPRHWAAFVLTGA